MRSTDTRAALVERLRERAQTCREVLASYKPGVDLIPTNKLWVAAQAEICEEAADQLAAPVGETGVTRFEVIDETGRVFTRWNTSIQLSYQDDGRTLKVFVEKSHG